MKINIIIIDKKSKDVIYAPLIKHYQNMINRFANIEIIEVFNKNISKAQDISSIKAQESYTEALLGYLKGGYNIALDPSSKIVNSYQFGELMRDKQVVNFFIGGAYGFEKSFLDMCDKKVSFGEITMSHKLVKVVLSEQIFRGLSIINNHPYHK
ncbi:LSU m3Psi1915 methyltransferase RlmH |uniref:LSU m3Psi1915 methyltransferase RlmH \